jgi:FAD/FMN-containing dehydrogenase/Fe-S oxidoreductase
LVDSRTAYKLEAQANHASRVLGYGTGRIAFVDEAQRGRIEDDLRGMLRGELHFDDKSRGLFSTDASIFQIQPAGVVVPRDEEDLCALVRYAAENQVPLVPRGAGTGLAGESLGSGLIVDMSRHFRGVLEVGEDFVRVQPGVVYHQLNGQLAKLGRRFAPDPTSGVQCTIGGMLATNASGARTLKHGYTRDYVRQARIVLDNGDGVSIGIEPRNGQESRSDSRIGELTQQVGQLIENNQDLLETCRPKTPFNRCGYLLHDVVEPESVDMARFLVGSEGTLAFFTEATLRTIPLPGGRAIALAGFDSLEAAIGVSEQALTFGPAACELIDRRLVSLARGKGGELRALLPAEAEAVLLMEFEEDSPAIAAARARDLLEHLQRNEQRCTWISSANELDDIDRLWRLRESILPSLYGLRSGSPPVAFVEDIAVPRGQLAHFLHEVQELLKRHEVVASFLVHAGTGQVHTRPFLDLQRPEDVTRLFQVGDAIHHLALELGGTVSTQHGVGLSRTPWVERQYGALYDVFRKIKTLFDPKQILNPGKIVGPLLGSSAWPLRQTPSADADKIKWQLRWNKDEVRSEATSCNGCGHCRTESVHERMCPIFRVTHGEAASPRAKANLVRQLLAQDPEGRALAGDDVREIADLCVNCRMCASECPAHVNIPKLMLEAKAANTAEHGLDRADWTLARSESFAALASLFAVGVNAVLKSRTARWFMEQILGISRKRRLPPFTSRNFLRQAKANGWTRRPRGRQPRVAYFVDVFANYNDPQIAEAVVRVLHHQGVEVYVPLGQRGCGMAPLAVGDVESAQDAARHNIRIFADLAREGYPIVCSEPTAALMLRNDYPYLVDDPDAQLVADRVVECTALLWSMHEAGRLRTDFRPLPAAIGHHVPCHLKALGGEAAGPRLLALIPEMRVHKIDVGCSGMAGTFGLRASNYDVSLEAGRALFEELRRPSSLFGSTECSACRMQMEEGAGKQTLHPVQYLALAYGLMPEIGDRLMHAERSLVLP